jgi:hypothetical protein
MTPVCDRLKKAIRQALRSDIVGTGLSRGARVSF